MNVILIDKSLMSSWYLLVLINVPTFPIGSTAPPSTWAGAAPAGAAFGALFNGLT